MSSVNIDLAADTILNVMVGQQDENEVREVVFDFSDWYTTYGSGTISLAIQRPKDEWPYEGTLTVDNSTHKATWEISDTDSAYAGIGQIQLSYTVGTAVKKSVVYRFTVYKSLGALGNVITPIQIQTFIDEVTEALEDMQEELNDVKQDLLSYNTRITALEQGGSGSGLTEDIKTALLQLAAKVAYIDDDGQDYYDDLEDALYPPATLSYITCVYTQSGTVYDNQSLDSLKPNLVVTAHYDIGTTETVTSYTLSGTLATGTSTITVSYGGKTCTFTVVVTHATTQYTITNTLTNCTNSNTSTVINEQTSYSGTLTADTGYTMGTVAITMGNTDITSTAYNSSTGAISIASVTGNIVITATATEPPITVDYTYPKTATWSPSAGTLSKAIGAKGTNYRVEVDVTSISAASAYVVGAVKGSGDASFGNGQSMAGQTGTISWTHQVKYDQEVGATTFKISCNKGSESSNQTAVISDIRIYEV